MLLDQTLACWVSKKFPVIMTVSAYPIHDAARTGDRKCLNDTLKSVDQLNAKDELGRTPMHAAAEVNEAAMGAYMAECGADVNASDNLGDTPLHVAARHGSRLVVSMLLWAEGDPLSVNNSGDTPLHVAVKAGQRDICWLLLENGGEDAMKMRNKADLTPLEIARETGASEELLELLLSTQVN